MKIAIMAAALIFGASVFGTASAQEPLTAAAQTVVKQTRPVHFRATVVDVNDIAHSITVRGSKGNDISLVVGADGESGKTFSVGDTVDLNYKDAVLLVADRGTGTASDMRKRVDTTTYIPEATGVNAAHQVEAQATIEAIDPVERTMTVRGAYLTVKLDVPADIDLASLHTGDIVQTAFLSAYSVHVVEHA